MTRLFNRSDQKSRRRVLRSDMPQAEIILWSRLKGKGLNGYKFRRQYGIGNYMVDFYCPELKLAIEVDGESHFVEGADEYDGARQEFIALHGVTVLRFTNLEIYGDMDSVLERIAESMPERRPPHAPPW